MLFAYSWGHRPFLLLIYIHEYIISYQQYTARLYTNASPSLFTYIHIFLIFGWIFWWHIHYNHSAIIAVIIGTFSIFLTSTVCLVFVFVFVFLFFCFVLFFIFFIIYLFIIYFFLICNKFYLTNVNFSCVRYVPFGLSKIVFFRISSGEIWKVNQSSALF